MTAFDYKRVTYHSRYIIIDLSYKTIWQWLLLTTYDCIWLSLTTHVWLHMTVFDYTYTRVTYQASWVTKLYDNDCFWLRMTTDKCLTAYDCVWLRMTHLWVTEHWFLKTKVYNIGGYIYWAVKSSRMCWPSFWLQKLLFNVICYGNC
jgi:hypothetical protein